MLSSFVSDNRRLGVVVVIMFLVGLATAISAWAEHNGSCHLPEGPLVIFEDILSDGWHIDGEWGGALLGGFTTLEGEQVLALQTSNPWTGVGVYDENLNVHIGNKEALVFRVRFEDPGLRLFVGMHRVYTNAVDYWIEAVGFLDGHQISSPVPGKWYSVRIPKATFAGLDDWMQGIVFQASAAGSIYIDNLAVSAGFALSFPLECSTPGCSGSGNINYTAGAYTPNSINSVVDHKMGVVYGKDGEIVSFTNERFNETAAYPKSAIAPCYSKEGSTAWSAELLNLYKGTGSGGAPGNCLSGIALNYDSHPGYDYSAAVGTTVKAAAAGTVVDFQGPRCVPKGIPEGCAAWGAVGIDHGNGYITQSLHMSDIVVEPGDTVAQGEIIGYSGATSPPSKSVPQHFHIEVLKRVSGSSGNSINDYKVVDPYGWNAIPQKSPWLIFGDSEPLLIQAFQLSICPFDRAHLKSETLSMLVHPLALIS